MKYTQNRSNGMLGKVRILPIFLLPMIVLILGGSAWANGSWIDEFDEFEVVIEINATDLDAGLQGKLDGDAWKLATVRGPDGRTIFRFNPRGSLGDFGVSEIQWESNEPPFQPSEEAEDDYTLDAFKALFPDGTYTVWGWKAEGGWLRSETELTYNLPAGPNVTSHEEDAEVERGSHLIITWNAVTTVFDPEDPQGESTDTLDSEIVAYIVVAEYDLVLNPGAEDEEEITRALTIDVPASELSAVIPADFLPDDPGPGNELDFKIEVGVVEESGNRTFWEVPLELVNP